MRARSLAKGGAWLAVAAGALASCVLDLDGLTGGPAGGGGGGAGCCLGDSCAPCGLTCSPEDCGGGPCVLAEGEGVVGPVGVVVVGQSLLWTSRGSDRIRRLDLMTGATRDFVTGERSPTLLATNGTHAVWVSDDGIWQCEISPNGCVSRRGVFSFAGGAGDAALVRGLAADARWVFWSQDNNQPSGAPLLRCGLEQPCSSEEASFQPNNAHPRGVVVDAAVDGFVYWAMAENLAGQGRIAKIKKDASPSTSFVSIAVEIDFPSAIALSGGDVLWTEAPPTETKEPPTEETGGVFRCPVDETLCRGDAVTAFPHPEHAIRRALDMAADAESVYWTNRASGTVMQCELPRCRAEPLVVAGNQAEPRGIAVAGDCVYWVDQTNGGRVLRRARTTRP
jgi:hypothetical protein